MVNRGTAKLSFLFLCLILLTRLYLSVSRSLFFHPVFSESISYARSRLVYTVLKSKSDTKSKTSLSSTEIKLSFQEEKATK